MYIYLLSENPALLGKYGCQLSNVSTSTYMRVRLLMCQHAWVSNCLCFNLHICQIAWLSTCFCVYLHGFQTTSVPTYAFINPHIRRPVFVSTLMAFHLLLCQPTWVSTCLCVELLTSQSVCASTYIYFYLLDSTVVSTCMGSGCQPTNVWFNRWLNMSLYSVKKS